MTSPLYLTVLHKYMNCNVKCNGEKIKTLEIKICVIFESEWTVDSSVVRMVIGLANWVLGSIFGTGEKEAERYVTGIVCWQQIVLGWLVSGWEGSGGIVRHLLENLDDESEGKAI